MTDESRPRFGVKTAGKKILGIIVLFIGLVVILGGYVASYIFKSSIPIAFGLLVGFIFIIGGAELIGIE